MTTSKVSKTYGELEAELLEFLDKASPSILGVFPAGQALKESAPEALKEMLEGYISAHIADGTLGDTSDGGLTWPIPSKPPP